MGYVCGNAGVTDSQPGERPPRLLDEAGRVMRLQHYSLRTEQACISWIRRFILSSGKRHPRQIDVLEVKRFLSGLVVARNVPAETSGTVLASPLAPWAPGCSHLVCVRNRACHRERRGTLYLSADSPCSNMGPDHTWRICYSV
jgi:Phage integrase, N-terminal SAM-like domain